MQNVVDFGARRANIGQSRLVSGLSSVLGERITRLFGETLAQCDDILFGHAQKATNGMRQAQYFDDLRQLRLSQAAAVQSFAHACRKAFDGGTPEPPTRAHRADDPLQLVADEDLEVDLALFRIGKRCDDAAPRLRHQVERRLAIVYGRAEGEPVPVSGSIIAKLCRAGLAPLDIGLESRLIVLKHLERQLSGAMESLLDAANALLVEHGILPNLRATPAAQRQHASPSSIPARTNGATAAASAPATALEVRQLGDMLGQVTQWMTQQAAPAAAQAIVASAPVAPQPTPMALPIADHDAELERERRRQDIQVRRAEELRRARELRGAAERSAEQVVAMVLSQAHVPDSIGNVVGGPLRRHLETVHARRGETSTEWRSACKLVRDIAWALDPETASAEQAHWREMVPGIVSSLRAALLAVGADDHEIDRIVADFGTRYERMLGAESSAAAPAPDFVEPAIEPIAATTRAVPSFGDALRQVRQLVLGRWFELNDDLGRPQRAKLVWTSAMTERCLFVNSHGKLVADRPHARVANDLIAGQFREIETGEPALA